MDPCETPSDLPHTPSTIFSPVSYTHLGAEVQYECDVQALLNIQMQVFLDCRLEVGLAGGQLVVSDLDWGEDEDTAAIGRTLEGEAGVCGCERDLCTLNHRALIVLNNTSDGSLVGLCPVSYTHLDVYKRQISYTADPVPMPRLVACVMFAWFPSLSL